MSREVSLSAAPFSQRSNNMLLAAVIEIKSTSLWLFTYAYDSCYAMVSTLGKMMIRFAMFSTTKSRYSYVRSDVHKQTLTH